MSQVLAKFFPTTHRAATLIGTRPVITSDEGLDKIGSWKGRGISLLHAVATPLKALSMLGRLVLNIIDIIRIVWSVVTLNSHPKNLLQALSFTADIVMGVVLVPIALIMNILRGLIGFIIHPAAMIKHGHEEGSFWEKQWCYINSASDIFLVTHHNKAHRHHLAYGTVINY